ncbi:MAG: helix-turn-helix transcriptional regulator [Pseudonocardiaceae bacterium]
MSWLTPVWEHAAMGKREGLVHARKAVGYTQESFAEEVGVDRSTVVRWEAGDHEPLPYLWPKIARVLSVSRDRLIELVRLPPSVRGGDLVAVVGSGESSDPVSSQGGLVLPVVIDGHPADDALRYAGRLDSTLHTIVELSGADVKRRVLLPGITFTAAAFAEPALLALAAPPVADAARDAGSRRIGMTDVEILTDSVAQLRRMDFRYGSGRIRVRVVRLLHDEATTLLHGCYSDSTGRALLTAVAQATRLAGFTAVDVGRHALAQRYYVQALNLAMNAGNRLFAGYMLCAMSRLTIKNATGQHCTHQAVALARAGKAVAGKATPALAAVLSAVEARAHALGRDASATRTAVLEAERHYERCRSDGEPAWLSFYTEAELAADLGRALRDSGEPAHAALLMTRTLDSYEPWRVRSRCLVQTDLATAYLVAGDHEHAAALTRDALNTAGRVSSRGTVLRIQSLQRQMRTLHSVSLMELDEEITSFLHSAQDDEDITT